MCTHNQYVRAKIRKKFTIFHLKIIIFTAVKYCSILHGRVCVMLHIHLLIQQHYDNVPMQYTASLYSCKKSQFSVENF